MQQLRGRGLKFGTLAILLVSAGLLSSPSASAAPVAVRYKEGLVHGFLVLSTLEGTAIAEGDLSQIAHGDRVTNQLVFRFKDGSRQEETTVFSQRMDFRLISYHLVQKGPSFKHATEISITAATGQVKVQYTDDDGKEKVATEHLAFPPDLANGLVPILLKNVRPGTPQIELPMVVAMPKPRLVKLVIHAQGTDPFSVGGSGREAIHYIVKVSIGGIAGAVAPLLGKEPPDNHVWIFGGEAPGGEAPAFVKSETLSYSGGPVWRIELLSPAWPHASGSDSNDGKASKP